MLVNYKHLKSFSPLPSRPTISVFQDKTVMVKRYHAALARRLGQNLAHYRRHARLTQEQVAEAIRVEVATISRYETGATLPSLVTLEDLAQLLRVTIADLLTEEKPVRSNESAQLLTMLESLTPDERHAVMEMLMTLTRILRKRTPAR
jgi:transcriptional regulator with XRE-family HTH domain